MIKILIIFLLTLSLVGCVTPKVGQQEIQIQQLQQRIAFLEKELSQKEEEIRFLEEELGQKKAQLRRREKRGISPKNIQIALRNAGFYKGPIDGKLGIQSKKAIREFQKANGLKPDGIVGKRTWEKLSKYLD